MQKSKAAIYIRVSTKEQETKNQLDVLNKWAADKGLQVTNVYQESESAWKDGHQAAFAELMEDATHYRFDYVLVWALDRLSRGGPLAVLQIIDRLKKKGVKLLSIQESWIEAPGELGDLLYAIVAWVARFESQRLSERVKAGQARARNEGKHMGRPLGKKDKSKRHRRTKVEIVAARRFTL
jgi:DNA invertase Pin-like site-specific DNA recombinase